MTDPFDEIRENTQRKLSELAKQKQAQEKLKQQLKEQKDAALLRFSKELSNCSPAIIEILDEFRISCSGLPNQRFEKISFHSSDLTANTDLKVSVPVDNGRNSYLNIFFNVEGDNSGNIKDYYLGTFWYRSRGDYVDDERVQENVIKLSPSASTKTIKDALLKLYKTFK